MATATDDDERGVFPDEEAEEFAIRTQRIWDDLRLPFDNQTEIYFREIDGKQFAYINPRAVRRRLNKVVGEDNWDNEVQLYPPVAGIYGCRQLLWIRLPGGQIVRRSAIGQGFDPKQADSDAFKRVCVLLGIGEYLYGDDEVLEAPRIEDLAGEPEPERRDPEPRREQRRDDRGQGRPDRTQSQRPRTWQEHAPPPESNGHRNGSSNGNGYPRRESNGYSGGNGRRDDGRRNDRGRQGGGNGGPPRSGKAFIAWVRGLVESRGQEAEGLEQHMSKWAKRNELSWKFNEWPNDAIPDAVDEAEAFLAGAN